MAHKQLGEGALIPAECMDLSGRWQFALDREDHGEKLRWFASELPATVRLPGSLPEQGIGDVPNSKTRWTVSGMFTEQLPQARYAPYHTATPMRSAFWLTPRTLYTGAAWYQREVDVPQVWQGKRVVVHLERPHWQTSLWLDELPIGTCTSLGTPHQYELPACTVGKHRLTIRVDNRMSIRVGADAHSISDHTQGNWNGIVGRICMSATEWNRIEDVRVTTDLKQRLLTFDVQLAGTPRATDRELRIRAVSPHHAFPGNTIRLPLGDTSAQVVMGIDEDARLWDEFSPALYRLEVDLLAAGRVINRYTSRFGLREVSRAGTQITVNGRPIFLRGTLECCIFPLTGYPPTDIESWRRLLGVARDYGLNHLRFHSWTPPRAAFDAADEAGFYLQVECSCWAEFGTGATVDRWLYEETDRVIRECGNHPSLIMLVASNEPSGEEQQRADYLEKWVAHYSASDARRLYAGGSGWPRLNADQFRVTLDSRALPVWTEEPSTSGDYSQYLAKQDRPIVSHEIGQYCAFPNVAEAAKYTGVFRATVLDVVRDFQRAAGMSGQAHEFLMASGRFQTEFYKEEIEACLRTRGWAGFQLLDLHDFPGQGTAPVGILDAFWDPKGYCTAEQFRRFCAPTVVLARIPRRIVEHGDQIEIALEVAHFGPADLVNAAVSWRLVSAGDNDALIAGECAATCVSTGSVTTLGAIHMEIDPAWGSRRLRLEASIAGTSIHNSWSLWCYPKSDAAAWPVDVAVVRELSSEVVGMLVQGRTVLLLPDRRRIAGFAAGVHNPLYWNRVTFPNNKAHLMGALIKSEHPALAGFPTDNHADWQWRDLFRHSKPMVLNQLPESFMPIVQPIDDWTEGRKLGLLLEARVGAGRLAVCSMDIETDLEHRPVARQLRQSLSQYLQEAADHSTQELTPELLHTLFRELTFSEQMGAEAIRADSAAPGHEPHHLLDGNPVTVWQTLWWGDAPSYPHEVVIRFDQEIDLQSVALIPRVSGNGGRFRDFDLYTSLCDGEWGRPASSGQMPADNSPMQLALSHSRRVRFIRLVAISPVDPNDKSASLSMIDIAGKPVG